MCINTWCERKRQLAINDGYARFVHCDYNIKRLDGFAADLLGKHGVKPREN